MIICNIDSRLRKKSSQVPQRILALRKASREARTHAEKMSFLSEKPRSGREGPAEDAAPG